MSLCASLLDHGQVALRSHKPERAVRHSQQGAGRGPVRAGKPRQARRRRWPSGKAAPAFTSPSEKLVWMSFTLGSLNKVSIAQRL
jgi:hypothetical protein